MEAHARASAERNEINRILFLVIFACWVGALDRSANHSELRADRRGICIFSLSENLETTSFNSIQPKSLNIDYFSNLSLFRLLGIEKMLRKRGLILPQARQHQLTRTVGACSLSYGRRWPGVPRRSGPALRVGSVHRAGGRGR